MRRDWFAKELRLRAAALRKVALGFDPQDDLSAAQALTRAAEDLEQRARRFESAGPLKSDCILL